MAAPVRLRSEAWLLLGVSSVPGELSLQSRRLSFTTHHSGSAWPWQVRKLERRLCTPGIAAAIDEGKKTQVFNWSTSEVRAWCPWYYFGGGIKLEQAGTVLRFSFGTPGNMKVRTHQAGSASVAEEAAASFSAVASMRSLGRQWQAALGACAHANHSDP